MTDELVKRLRENWITDKEALEVADRIEALTAERDVSNELGKALEEDAGQLREENAKLTADKRFILEERDRTFALMLARAEAAEAERDHAWAMVEKADTQMGQSLADNLQAKADATRLRALLAEADRRIVWEANGFGNDFAEQVAAALKGESHE